MGSSSSQAVTTANTDITNDQSISNKNIYESTISKMNEATVQAFQSASKKSGAVINTSNSFSMGNIVATGKGSVVNANINQKITAALNFSGVQSSQMKTDIINQASQAAAQMLENEFKLSSDNDLKASGSTNSQAQATVTPFALGGQADSSTTSNTNTKIINKINVQNETQTKISDFMSNKLNTEIHQNDVQDCMTTLSSMQSASAGNLIASDGGIINFESSQGIDAALTSQCKQLGEAISSAVAAFEQSSEFTSKNTSDAAITTKATAESTASASSISDAGSMASMPSSASFASSGVLTMIIPIIIGIIVLCCIISIIKKIMGSGGGGDGGDSGGGDSGGGDKTE